MLQLIAKYHKVQHGVLVNIAGFLIYSVYHQKRICGTCDATQLPIDLPFDAHHVEEHLNSAQLGRQSKGREILNVFYVYVCSNLKK